MDHWPMLDPEEDSSTFAILHLASQMLGKLRVAHAPWANHGWHVTLLPVAAGLAMPPIAASGRRFELVLDLCAHAIVLRTSDGRQDSIGLETGSIASLHAALVAMLEKAFITSGAPNWRMTIAFMLSSHSLFCWAAGSSLPPHFILF